jgi:hypothetical protein
MQHHLHNLHLSSIPHHNHGWRAVVLYSKTPKLPDSVRHAYGAAKRSLLGGNPAPPALEAQKTSKTSLSWGCSNFGIDSTFLLCLTESVFAY